MRLDRVRWLGQEGGEGDIDISYRLYVVFTVNYVLLVYCTALSPNVLLLPMLPSCPCVSTGPFLLVSSPMQRRLRARLVMCGTPAPPIWSRVAAGCRDRSTSRSGLGGGRDALHDRPQAHRRLVRWLPLALS